MNHVITSSESVFGFFDTGSTLYQVYRNGAIVSRDRFVERKTSNGVLVKQFVPGKLIKTRRWGVSPYLSVNLNSGKNKQITVHVHTVVARVFLGQKPDGYEVNHIDENPLNNAADNLEYLSSSDNKWYSLVRTGRASGKVSYSQRAEIKALFESGLSCEEIGTRYGISAFTAKSIACERYRYGNKGYAKYVNSLG